MPADGESTGKSKARKAREESESDELTRRTDGADENDLEAIPTRIPVEGDGYIPPGGAAIDRVLKKIGDPGSTPTGR